MTLKTLKQKANNLLMLDDEFLQYCELNNIEDVQKLARETFKRGFDILKYGEIPDGLLTRTVLDGLLKPSAPDLTKMLLDEKNFPKVEKNNLYDE